MDYDVFDGLLHHIYKQIHDDAWFKPSEQDISSGVCIRVEPGRFRVFPYDDVLLAPFELAVRGLNPMIAAKVRSAAVHAALKTVSEDAPAIHVDKDTRIQIIPTMSMLSKAEKDQCVAFIRDERVLVVWSDNFDDIIPLWQTLDQKLIRLIWNHRFSFAVTGTGTGTSLVASSDLSKKISLSDAVHTSESSIPEKPLVTTASIPVPRQPRHNDRRNCFGWSLTTRVNEGGRDVEGNSSSPRPTRLLAPFYDGFGVALSLYFIGGGIYILMQETILDGHWYRWALLVTSPLTICIALFFALQIVSNVSMILGPVAQYNQNSKFYSAIPPRENPFVDAALPHITIEMPVYRESLEKTIAPSVYSIKKAMQTYARQGGTSAIFVHDDGLQIIPEHERAERIAFYADHNIGWIARPPHDPSPGGFKRAGRFKKASNMNYGLLMSLKLEKHLQMVEKAHEGDELGEVDELLEERALHLALEEIFEESGGRWRPWASNAKSLRIGEFILLVDSDTVVPEDCLRDAAREFAESLEVAIIQHESDVMQVAHHYFENGIAYFTRRINKCISLGSANGEVAPFVGHNAFLRWSALQDAAFVDKLDGKKKIWSESNVSEDFDMALRLQLKDYVIRWANYSAGGFKEGVSLTVNDELNRWQKYSYGCSELMFNPFVDWLHLGPITEQLRIFLWSRAPVYYKITMLAYMFSYYGIAASALLVIINYFMLGFGAQIDGYYLHSFETWLAIIVVFLAAGNLGFVLLEYRLDHGHIMPLAIETITWIPFFFFFFGGLSIHLSASILAHMFSYNITWGATQKEVERSNFFIEVPRILKRFWFSFALSFVCILCIALFGSQNIVSAEWQIPLSDWASILPLALFAGNHILFPIVLNPWLMIFSY